MEQTQKFEPEQPEASGSEAVRILRQKAKDGSLKSVLADWKWIFSFTRGRWFSVALYTLFGVITSAIGLLSGVLGKYLIDCIVAMDRSRLLPLAAATVAVAVAGMVFRGFSARFSARLGVDMLGDVRSFVFRKLMSSQWMSIRQYSTGDLLARFSGDVRTVANSAMSWLPTVIIQLFTVLSTLAVVLYYDPVMALLAFASTPALFLASRRLLRRQRDFNKKLRQVGSDQSAFESETFRNIDTLKSFGVEDGMAQRLDSWQDTYRDVTMDYTAFSVRTNLLLSSMGMMVQYLAMGYCMWRLWRGEILFGTMVLFLQQRSQLSGAFSSLISQIPAALSGSVAAERVRELTELPKEERQLHRADPDGSCALEMQDLRLAYSDDRRVVLDGVSLRADAGTVVALVGPSGEGKSTLMRLMLGLMEPQNGKAYLLDRSGKQFPLGADTRHLFAYVPQGNTVLAGTVAENLRLVNPEATEAEMITALEDACAWEFVRELPRGIHSTIGEGGKGLSEGQAQRIAIARALVRRAPVLLLDEVTSALDFETEQKVLSNLTRRGVTCVAATHRPSVLGMCSRVYRVRDGGVQELSRSEIVYLMNPEL